MSQTFLIVGIILVQLFFLLCLIIFGYLFLQGICTVPWVRTRSRIAREMLELAEFKKGDLILDLGSGDGSIVLTAIELGGFGIGIERLWLLIWFSKIRAKFRACADKATFVRANIFTAQLPDAQIVTCYLFPKVNAKLEPRLMDTFPPGTRIVSRDFRFPTLTLLKQRKEAQYTLYLYQL